MATIDPKKLERLQGEELLSTLEQEAVRCGISDIHLNPQKSGIQIEWRALGLLQTLLTITPDIFEAMKRRIKFKAK